MMSCSLTSSKKAEKIEKEVVKDTIIVEQEVKLEEKVLQLFKENPLYKANSFDYPVGKPNAKGYYNAQAFGKNSHLGDDWNAVTGGNSDLGDPIYAVANGYVHFAEDYYSGWGNIIRIWHETKEGKIVESFYAHCDEILVKVKQFVKKGDKIGTIGNVDGTYYAHLHLEMREDIELPVGPGYADETTGYLDPTKFIKENR